MPKFGTARMPESFGVAGLLGDEARVFHCALTSRRHAGRVADLVVARLSNAQPEEWRVRAALGALLGAKSSQPLRLECGVDAEKIALGATVTLAEPIQDLVALARGLGSIDGPSAGELEPLLRAMYLAGHRLVLRYQQRERRLEIVALIGLPGKMELPQRPLPAEVYSFGKSPESAPPANYVELGDLDFRSLLGEEVRVTGAAPATAPGWQDKRGQAEGTAGDASEFALLKARYEKASKQVDEFKKQIRELSEQLAEARSQAAKRGKGRELTEDETKKRLEAAMKLLVEARREVARLNQLLGSEAA